MMISICDKAQTHLDYTLRFILISHPGPIPQLQSFKKVMLYPNVDYDIHPNTDCDMMSTVTLDSCHP